MGWGFQSLQKEIESVELDILRCQEMIKIEKQSIKEMEQDLVTCSTRYLQGRELNCMNSCNGCGKDDEGEIWGKRFIRESRSEIRRYKKLLKWKTAVLKTMQTQPKHLRSVA